MGIDLNKDGKIGTWTMISAEVFNKEVQQALITRDYPRFQARELSHRQRCLDAGPATTRWRPPLRNRSRMPCS